MKRLLLSVAAIAALAAATAALAAPNGTASVRLVKVTSPVARGKQAYLLANVVPGGLCTIVVSRRGNRMQTETHKRWGLGLYPKRTSAAEDGRVTWTWTIEPGTALGSWRIRVSCGSAGSFQTSFRVVRRP